MADIEIAASAFINPYPTAHASNQPYHAACVSSRRRWADPGRCCHRPSGARTLGRISVTTGDWDLFPPSDETAASFLASPQEQAPPHHPPPSPSSFSPPLAAPSARHPVLVSTLPIHPLPTHPQAPSTLPACLDCCALFALPTPSPPLTWHPRGSSLDQLLCRPVNRVLTSLLSSLNLPPSLSPASLVLYIPCRDRIWRTALDL
jgi:hypothetical protein